MKHKRTIIGIRNKAFEMGLSAPGRWTEEEDNIIRKYYPLEGMNVSKRLPGRSRTACMSRAQTLKVSAPNKSWSKEEHNLLKKYYSILGASGVLKYVNRPIKSIYTEANKLGLHWNNPSKWTEDDINILIKYYPVEGKQVNNRLPHRSWESINHMITRLRLNGHNIKSTTQWWSPEETDIVKKYYPIEGNQIIKRLPNRTLTSIISYASKIGVKSCNACVGWTEEEKELLRKWYPIEGKKISECLPNHSQREVMRKAYSMGLRRSYNCTKDKNEVIENEE